MENGNTFNQQNQNFTPQGNIVNYKSATVAGLLGIFLGSIGVHDFYLGDKKKGIIHVILASIWLVVDMLIPVILTNALDFYSLYAMAGFIGFLNFAGGVCLAVSSIWGLVDGIRILIAGDAGLAARGLPVAPQPRLGGQNPYNNMQTPQSPENNQPTQNDSNNNQVTTDESGGKEA